MAMMIHNPKEAFIQGDSSPDSTAHLVVAIRIATHRPECLKKTLDRASVLSNRKRGKAGDKYYGVRWGRGWGHKGVTRPPGISTGEGGKGSWRSGRSEGQEETEAKK